VSTKDCVGRPPTRRGALKVDPLDALACMPRIVEAWASISDEISVDNWRQFDDGRIAPVRLCLTRGSNHLVASTEEVYEHRAFTVPIGPSTRSGPNEYMNALVASPVATRSSSA
jgi:hypothetical protein